VRGGGWCRGWRGVVAAWRREAWWPALDCLQTIAVGVANNDVAQDGGRLC
jgi:hypothetical protein